jgi:hypothetical protein
MPIAIEYKTNDRIDISIFMTEQSRKSEKKEIQFVTSIFESVAGLSIGESARFKVGPEGSRNQA